MFNTITYNEGLGNPFNYADGREIMKARVNNWMQTKAKKPGDPDWIEANLHQELNENPEQLEIFFALYKRYCQEQRFDEAEKVTLTVLNAAAEHFGIDTDHEDGWRELSSVDIAPGRLDSPSRLLLHSLKALAGLMLYQMHPIKAWEILRLLETLDPEDRVGASSVRQRISGLTNPNS